MNEQTIADLTRDLIDACGGLEEASRHCRLKVTQLSRCQTAGSGNFLALDVVIALETYAKQPIISRAMMAHTPDSRRVADLGNETGEAVEAVVECAKVVRMGDRSKPSVRREIRRKIQTARTELADVERALDAEEKGAA